MEQGVAAPLAESATPMPDGVGPPRPLLALLDDAAEPDAQRLVAAAREHGAVATIHTGNLGSLEVEIVEGRVAVRLDGDALQPLAVLVWRVPSVCQHPRREELEANPVARSFHVSQWFAMLRGLLMAWELDGVPVVNGAHVGRWDEKTAQVALAASVGFRTPHTLQSATPAGIRTFLSTRGGSGVTKAFVPYHSYDPITSRAVRQLTRIVAAEEIGSRVERAVPTPAVFQPLIAAGAELRVVLVGDEVFAARIDRDRLGHVDSRHPEPAQVPAEAFEVAEPLARRCRALLARCGLHMAVIDLLIDADGEAVFLDLNPTGTFDWIACRFDLPIYGAVARLLVDLAARAPMRRAAP